MVVQEVVLAGAAVVSVAAALATRRPPKTVSGFDALLTDLAALWYASNVFPDEGPLTTPLIPQMQ